MCEEIHPDWVGGLAVHFVLFPCTAVVPLKDLATGDKNRRLVRKNNSRCGVSGGIIVPKNARARNRERDPVVTV